LGVVDSLGGVAGGLGNRPHHVIADEILHTLLNTIGRDGCIDLLLVEILGFESGDELVFAFGRGAHKSFENFGIHGDASLCQGESPIIGAALGECEFGCVQPAQHCD
jgi:hypothetical protein